MQEGGKALIRLSLIGILIRRFVNEPSHAAKFYAESQLKYERELIKKSHKAIKKTTEKVDRIFVVTAYMAIIITIDLVITVIFM